MAELNNVPTDPIKYSKLQEIKVVLPQILAATVISTLSVSIGIGTVFSAILLPQLKNVTNNTNADSFRITNSEGVWFTSSIGLIMPVGSIVSGVMTDNLGRIKVLQMSLIPHVVGWSMIALANNAWLLLGGRVITAFAATLVIIPSFVYISEISSPKIRGALLSLTSVFYNGGMLITYLNGWIVNWRTIAWFTVAYCVISFPFILFIPESPLWLINKKNLKSAQKSLNWLHKHEKTYAAERYDDLIFSQTNDTVKLVPLRETIASTFKQFTLPTGYKPFILLSILAVVQQFSGIHVIMMNAVTFFDSIGTKFDPYLACIYMSSMRFVMSIIQVWLMKQFGRRILLMTSCLGMSICMIVAGVCTKLLHEGSNIPTWIPLSMMILYFLFLSGLVAIPAAIASELFPLSIRGLASNIVAALICLMLFAALQSFEPLCKLLGGLYGCQYLYGVVAALGFVFVLIYLPESHNKDLSSMQSYFENNTVYISLKCKSNGIKE